MATPAPPSIRTDSAERYRATRTVTLVGALVNAVLTVLKLLCGYIGQSQALIADGIHSLSDLATDVMVVVAAKHGSRDADEAHPYGHARIETAFTVLLGGVLILVGLGLMIDAGRRVLEPALLLHPGPLALGVAAISIIAKEALYQYTARVARRLRSPLLRANAWHHRSDAISSVVVLVGVLGTLMGFAYLDAFATVGVALMIAKIGWDVGWEAVRELIDTGLEPERLATIRQSIHEVEGVTDFHMLRTRRVGGAAFVDVHIQVSPRLSVSEGHQIGEYVRTRLTETIDEVADVTVHVDPEDDESNALCNGLPLRREVVAELHARWRPVLDPAQISRLNLHYLSGRIHVELVIPLHRLDQPATAPELSRQLRLAVREWQAIGEVLVYFV